MSDEKELKDLFVSEVGDYLQKLNEKLLAFEKNQGEKEILDEIMRAFHTLKGSSAMMGYRNMSSLAHAAESVCDLMRMDAIAPTTKIINGLFAAVDALEHSLATIQKTNKEPDLAVVTKKTLALSSGAKTQPRTPLRAMPPEPREASKGDGPAIAPPSPLFEEITHIKVPVARLDTLMSLMEELLIDNLKLRQTMHASSSPDVRNQSSLREDSRASLGGVIDHLDRTVSDMQYQIMQARLVPLEQIFARFTRMVRDLAQTQKKEVTLEMQGGDMELDRTIVDKLGEPLLHLLRNAIDHGIETRGIIKLKAAREREYALISVENSGARINWRKIIDIAVARGIIDGETGNAYRARLAENPNSPPPEIVNLLYRARISTKDVVTETSGRGVGLSVVKNFVEEIGGRVIVETGFDNGGGTRFTLELPLTLAIVNALIAEVRRFKIAIPFSSVERIVALSSDDVKSMADQDVAVVDGVDIPLVRLDRIFFSQEPYAPERRMSPEPYPVVLAKRGNDIAGIVVDGVVNKQEIVVKSFPPALRGVKGFSGATMLGDGKTILILDVASLLEDTKKLLRVTPEKKGPVKRTTKEV